MSEGLGRTRTCFFMDVKGIEPSRIRAAERSRQKKRRMAPRLEVDGCY